MKFSIEFKKKLAEHAFLEDALLTRFYRAAATFGDAFELIYSEGQCGDRPLAITMSRVILSADELLQKNVSPAHGISQKTGMSYFVLLHKGSVIGAMTFSFSSIISFATKHDSFKGAGTFLYLCCALLNYPCSLNFEVARVSRGFYERMGASRVTKNDWYHRLDRGVLTSLVLKVERYAKGWVRECKAAESRAQASRLRLRYYARLFGKDLPEKEELNCILAPVTSLIKERSSPVEGTVFVMDL